MDTHKKIFSGSEITALAVKNILEENNVEYIERNDIQSAIRSGFGSADQAVHIFVLENDLEKSRILLSDFELIFESEEDEE